ncbi:MAG: lipopolysaccharide biosynthesis protein [Desulfocapsaceae bacterium]
MEDHLSRAARLAILAIVGQGLVYLLSVILARQLGIDGFESYAVASAAFTLMVVVSPRGIEKYALRLIPSLYEREDWGAAKGFLKYSLQRTLGTTLVVGSLVFVFVQYFSPFPASTKQAIIVSCLSLPSGALVHYGIEVLSANGRDITATALFRVAVPSVTLLIVLVIVLLPVQISGAMAVGCWGISWTIVFVILATQIKKTTPFQLWSCKSIEDLSTWKKEALPFQNYRITLALLAQIGVIFIDRLHPSAAAVGGYVAAASTVNLALVLATATNRFYSRRLSILLEQRDFAGILKLRKERLQWLLPCMLLFLLIIFVFGRQILGFFRPEFVTEGIAALQILAITTTIVGLFSLGPTYLKYMGHNRAIFTTMLGAVVCQIIMLVVLVPRFAATGGAIAYALSMGGMYLMFARMAHNKLVQIQKPSEKP